MRLRGSYLVFLLLLSLVSCSDSDQFTTSKDAFLTLPADTLTLDTAISGIPTGTYSLVIRNHGSKGIRITKARLLNGEEFQANVDGTNINAAYDYPIEVRKKDSITVFIKMKSKVTSSDTARKVEDILRLELESGKTQDITLIGYSQDVYTLSSYTISKDTVFTSNRPVHITGSLTVDAGSILTITPGATLLFSPGSSLIVKGTVNASGKADSVITFRCDRLDHMFKDQPYDRIPGMWGEIELKATSFDNYFNFAEIHGGNYGILADSSDVSKTKVRMENSRITNTKGDCIKSVNSKVFLGNTELSNALGNCVSLYGGNGNFIHCTIANFYPFEGNRGNALWLYNSYNGRKMPLEAASFSNCIITGWSTDEIFASFLDDNTAKSYLFRSCLLTTPKPDDTSEYPGCIFENTNDSVWGEKNFRKFDYDKLIFDFRLKKNSPAIGNADFSISSEYYPYDRNTVSRLSDNKADMGCYEYQKDSK